MVSQPFSRLPSTAELPCSDDTPVDDEEQNLLPNLLLFALSSLWSDRMDWFLGAGMAVYHTTGQDLRVPVVPDAFLSIGVERRKASQPRGRPSYALWEENEVAPILVIELVSHIPGGEYDEKLEIYRRLGALYYALYNPRHWERDQHQPFEIYKLEDDGYQLQGGEPFWMPEVGLGIGRDRRIFGGIEREVLRWYDEDGQAHLSSEEKIEKLRSQLKEIEAERRKIAINRKIERMESYLRSLGIDPDNLPDGE